VNITVGWNIAPCSLVETDRRFRDACCIHHRDVLPDDGGSKHFSSHRRVNLVSCKVCGVRKRVMLSEIRGHLGDDSF
jgi:hypothetical protein